MATGLVAKPLEYDRSWMEKWDRAEFEPIKERLKASYSHFDGTANIVYYEARQLKTKTNMACHAQMNYFGKGERDNPYRHLMGTDNGSSRTHEVERDRAIQRPFFDWFIKDSPFAEIILNRDDPEFCWDYGFVFSCLAPQPLVMNTLIVSRHFREVSLLSFETWNELVAQDVHPWLAYEACFNSGLSSRNTPTNSEFNGYGGHRMHSASGLVGLLRYFRGDWGLAQQDSMLDKKSIYGASALFAGGSLYTEAKYQEEIQEALAKHRGVEPDAALYKPPNPFEVMRRANTYSRTIAKDDYTRFSYGELSVVLPVLQEIIIKELAKNA